MARLAIVASVLARHDAVTAAVHDTGRALEAAGHGVSLFALRNDFRNRDAEVVTDLAALLLHPLFQAAELVLYHFAIHSPLFDAMIALSSQVPQIAAFHNITPAALVAPPTRPVIEQSFRQLYNLRHVERIWAVSDINAEVLASQDFDRSKIEVIPLSVDRPAPARLADKPAMPIEILFVGRFVRSKGVLDLVRAFEEAQRRTPVPLRLALAGNLNFSDPEYAASVRAEIDARRLGGCIRFLGAVDDARLGRLYRRAHILAIPSYHEGFCVPVVEGLRAGCIPVAYAAHNLPAITHGLGRLIAPGDCAALAVAIADLAVGLVSGAPLRLEGGAMTRSEFDHAAQDHVRQFAFSAVAPRMVRSVDAVLSERSLSAA